MRCLFHLFMRCAVVTVALFATEHAVSAQNAGDATEAADPAEWQALVAKKKALVDQLKAMAAKIETAEAAEQQKMVKEAQALQQEFQKEISPRMVELAPAVYKANPQDIDAAEIMLQVAYGNMRYDNAAQIAAGILKTQPDHALALNVGGVSNFAIHNFEASVDQLEAAQQEGALYPQLGEQYIDSARDYVGYWSKEAQIRKQEASATGDQQLPRVKMTTSKGEMILELFENEAPNTVANFITLVEKGYYDGLEFHRVIPSFMAQGGCPNTREGAAGVPGTGGPGYVIECEAYEPNARRHFGGTLSMAHAGRDTGGSQFFITHLPTPHLDQEVRPESVHTVFGRVVEGMPVVWSLRANDVIQKVEVLLKRNHDYKPVTQASNR